MKKLDVAEGLQKELSRSLVYQTLLPHIQVTQDHTVRSSFFAAFPKGNCIEIGPASSSIHCAVTSLHSRIFDLYTVASSNKPPLLLYYLESAKAQSLNLPRKHIRHEYTIMSGIAKAIPSHLKPSSALRSSDNGDDASKRHHGKSQSHVVSSFPLFEA